MSVTIMRDLIQRTDEWQDARRGILTASAIGKLITVGPPAAISVACPTCDARPEWPCVSKARKEPTPIKSMHDARIAHADGRPPVYEVADNETSRGLVMAIVAERLTGWTEDLPLTSDVWRGLTAEPYARDLYAKHHAPVEEVGFIRREETGWTLGYSPDGLVGDDGLIEIKAPRAKTHLRTILADEVPAHHMPQLQAGLLVTGRKWIDFVSYVGGMPLWVKRVWPDEQWFDAIEAAARAFETTAAEMTAAYETATNGLPRTKRLEMEITV